MKIGEVVDKYKQNLFTIFLNFKMRFIDEKLQELEIHRNILQNDEFRFLANESKDNYDIKE